MPDQTREPDMTEAPERIWHSPFDTLGTVTENPERHWEFNEYIRADVVDHAAIREAALREAAGVAFNACLVPPDGGNPTEEERLVCDEAYRRILALIDKKEDDK